MDADILNNNGMEEEYIRKSFIVPNAAIKVACFKAGMTEEMLYKRCIGLGCTEEESKMLVQKCFHPTEEDLELEKL